MADDGPAIRLSDLGAQLRRRWRVVVVTVLVCTGVATAAAWLLPSSYTATSVLTVESVALDSGSGGSDGDDVNITTERAVVESSEVARAARRIMGSTVDPRDLAERISVTSPMEAQVIEIDAAAPSAPEAAATANAFAQGYLGVRGSAATGERDRRIGRIDARLDELAAGLPADPSAASAVQEEMSSLRDQRSELTSAPTDPGRVITTATPPRESFLRPLVYPAGAAAGGLLLGLGLALWRERSDRKVRSALRLADVLGSPVLEYRDAPTADEDEFVNRLVIRLGLHYGKQDVTVGVLGVDRASADVVSSVLTDYLLRSGYRAQLVRWSGSAAPNGTQSPAGASVLGYENASTFVVAASVDGGLARTAMLGQRVDKVVVTVSPAARITTTTALIEELSAVDVRIDAIAVSARRNAPAVHAGYGDNEPRQGQGARPDNRSGEFAGSDWPAHP